jgi:hypothetical protein
MGEATMSLPTPFGEHHTFPPIHDWNSLVMGFARTACEGWCPDYSVEIHGDGKVRYKGNHCVSVQGVRTAHLPQNQVRKMFEAFQWADFFSLKDRYSEGWVDAPGIALWIRYDQWKWQVFDANQTLGMPGDAAALPDLIDATINSNRWVGTPSQKCLQE